MGKIIRQFLCKINRKRPSEHLFGGGVRKLDNKTPNILFRNINEFNVKLILIIGVLFIMLSGYTSYALFTDTIISNNIINLKIGKKNYEKFFSYTGNCEEYTVPYNGYYKIEAWGAEGGTANATYSKGGKGGYTSGITKLLKGEKLYICVGGKGSVTNGEVNQTSLGGFNGGGNGKNNTETANVYIGSGGGATDIRLVGGTWNNETGLNSRIMVAAGGGGSHWFSTDWYGSGGSGGGLIGIDGVAYQKQTSGEKKTITPKGGTQTGINFGFGESSVLAEHPGGGSGYYGGNKDWGAGSGGSSFISGYAGVNAITKDFEKMQNVRYIKDCVNGNTANEYSHWLELQAYSGGVNVALGKTVTSETTTHSNLNILVDGVIDNNNYVELGNGNKCVVVDLGQTYDIERINTYFYYEDGRKYNGHSVYVSSNNANWTTIVENENGVGGTSSGTSVSSITHTNDTLHYSNKYFINGKMQAGTNTGNGKAKITYVSSIKPKRINTNLDNVRYIKDCTTGDNSNGYKSWEEIQAIKNGINIALGKSVTGTGKIHASTSGTWSYNAVTDGNIANFNGDDAHTTETGNQCITVDLGQTYDLDEIAVWHYWKAEGTYYNNYTYVSSNNTDWTLIIDKQEPETSEGKRVSAYDGVALQLQQNTGGTLTCKNNTTEINSTSSLKVSKGDNVTCTSNVNSGYRLTSLKIGNTSITSGTTFTYNYDTSVTIIPTYYRYCSQTEAYSYGSWSACSASCGGGTQTRTVYYRDKNYTSYTSCGTSTESQSCNTQSCVVTCGCGYRSSTYKNVPQWSHSICSDPHTTAYLHLCYCSDGSIYNCTSSGWSAAGGSGCYVHTGYNNYTALDYSWSNYSGSYW